jgi:hypothetical protein
MASNCFQYVNIALVTLLAFHPFGTAANLHLERAMSQL